MRSFPIKELPERTALPEGESRGELGPEHGEAVPGEVNLRGPECSAEREGSRRQVWGVAFILLFPMMKLLLLILLLSQISLFNRYKGNSNKKRKGSSH